MPNEIEIDATSAHSIRRMIDVLVEEGASRKSSETYLALAYDLGRTAAKREQDDD